MTEIDFLGSGIELAEALQREGFTVDRLTDNSGEITSESTGNIFFLHVVEGWLQLRCIYCTPEMVLSSISDYSLFRTLLLLHFRLLGCRFAVDEDNAIWLLEDLIAAEATPDRILTTLNQLQFVIDATLGPLQSVMESGKELSDEEIDSIFELQAAKDAGSTH